MTCYKCGKELADGGVECDPACGQTEESKLVLTIELRLNDRACITCPEYLAAQQKFSELLGEILVDSGLSEFMRTK